ncbi:MAG TPA: hypothetical protein VIW64_09385 [Pyrinomonadaceae bacterium]
MAKPVNNNLTNWQVAPGLEGRVKEAFGGATLAEIASKTGENYHTLRNYLKLKRDAPPRLWIAIAELTNYSPFWLLANKGPKLLESRSSGALFHLGETELTAEEKRLIRREVIEVLSELLAPLEKDRKTMDALARAFAAKLQQENV